MPVRRRKQYEEDGGEFPNFGGWDGTTFDPTSVPEAIPDPSASAAHPQWSGDPDASGTLTPKWDEPFYAEWGQGQQWNTGTGTMGASAPPPPPTALSHHHRRCLSRQQRKHDAITRVVMYTPSGVSPTS